MEYLDTATSNASAWVTGLLNTDLYDGKSLADYLTFDTLVGLAVSVLGAAAIILLGFLISGLVGRRIRKLGKNHASLDYTLFTFLSNIARYTIRSQHFWGADDINRRRYRCRRPRYWFGVARHAL